IVLLQAVFFVACYRSANDNVHTTATTIVTPPPAQNLKLVSRPAWIEAMMQTTQTIEARPELSLLSPSPNQILNGSVLAVRVKVNGALSVYSVKGDSFVGAVASSDHIHLVLDNQPYEEYSDLSQPHELRNLTPGRHTLRVFVCRPWHESYKNDGAF